MKIVCPYAGDGPEPGTVQALAGYRVELVDVSSSDEAYWGLLAGLWSEGETFAIVEQDVTVAATTLGDMEACDNVWCAAQYGYLGSSNYAGLGCVKFDGRLTREHPDVMEVAGRYEDEAHTPRHWCVQDFAIQQALHAKGIWVCENHGRVGHRSGPPSHGCCG